MTDPHNLHPGAVHVSGGNGWRGALLRKGDETVEWSCSHADHGVSQDSAIRCAIAMWEQRFKDWRISEREPKT